MDRSVKQPGANTGEWAGCIAFGAAAGLSEAAGLSIRIGEYLYSDTQQQIPWNPLSLAIHLATGSVEWTGAATGGAVTLMAGTAAGVAGGWWAYRATCAKCRQWRDKVSGRTAVRKRRREVVDERARYMARGRELASLHKQAIFDKAAKLKVQLKEGQAPGVLIGRTVADGREIYGSYEDLHLDIWGPRQGKSTSRVIPAVMDAPGAVVATSNKRDVVDATRDPRGELGRVWVFDPQGVAEEAPTWCWDPIAWVYGVDGDGAQERAAELAGHFAAANEGSNGGDAFFEPEGEDLLAGLFLACAMDKQPITQAFAWVTSPDEEEPVQILKDSGFELAAGALVDQYKATPKQKSGVFSTAKKMASCLKFDRIRPWVTPGAGREEFTVEEFVRSTDTLYPLSEEGKGNAAPLITAMAAAVAAAAKTEGGRHGGRLPVPMLIVLDEAANIVRWKDLPKQYSHFGSRGIVVMTILQSWAQGVRCWGSEGMTALWSAANIKVLGSGLDDAGFLRDRSELIGDHYEHTTSVSKSKGGSSSSISRTTERTLTSSDLSALPRGRCVVFTSGHRATLVETVPWFDRDYAPVIEASIDAHDPAKTIHKPSARPHLRSVPRDEEDAA
ncbi:type IV secretory system conjugative DNA transfer family protein [Nocardia cyriacigeorgica]|nr:TraM recognition domain-containing protein [Nocardia cyriacigeorgica]